MDAPIEGSGNDIMNSYEVRSYIAKFLAQMIGSKNPLKFLRKRSVELGFRHDLRLQYADERINGGLAVPFSDMALLVLDIALQASRIAGGKLTFKEALKLELFNDIFPYKDDHFVGIVMAISLKGHGFIQWDEIMNMAPHEVMANPRKIQEITFAKLRE